MKTIFQLIFFLLVFAVPALAQPSSGSSVKVWDGAQTADVTAASAVKVDNSAVTQPVSGTFFQATQPVSGTFFQATQPVSGTLTCNAGTNLNTSALATSTNQTTIIGHVDGLEVLLTTIDADTGTIAGKDFATQTTLAALNTKIPSNPATDRTTAAAPFACRLSDGASFYNASGSGSAGTEYTEGDVDASITGSAILMEGAANTLLPVQGTVADGLLVNLGANNDVTASQTGTWNVTNVSGTVSLPTGAATSALQTTGNSSLSSIDGKTPALGQALAAASSPVVLTAAQMTTLTPLSTVAATQSGTWTVQPGNTANTTAWKVDGSAVTQPVSGTFWQATQPVSGTVAATQSGTWNITNVSGTVSLPTGASTAANQSTEITALQLIDNLVLTEDLASTTLDPGVQCLAVRASSPANTSSTNGDYEPLQVNAGRLWTSTTIDAALPAGSAVIGHVIADSGSTTAVTGTVAVTQSGTWTVQPGNTANTTAWKVDASSVAVPVTDNSGSLTVDAPVGTPAFVRLSDGAAAITTLPVSLASVPSHAVTNAGTFAVQSVAAGDVAHDGADSGNPVKVGGKAANALPTAVANNDRTNFITDLFGRHLVAEIDPAMQIHKSVAVSTTQTGSDIWSPTSGKKIAVQSYVISSAGTTGCDAIVWFGLTADVTFTQGTDQVLAYFSAVPSATIKPGMVGPGGGATVFSNVADNELHLTTSAGCTLNIQVDGYEF